MSKALATLMLRALRIEQTPGCPLYLFSLTASEILQVADISRASRDQSSDLIGYQCPEVRQHIQHLSAVKATFPDAWGKPPSQSRLMHGAG